MALIDRFPTNGWKNQKLKQLVQSLLELESEFESRKAPATLSSVLLTLGNVYKEDAGLISFILARPAVNTARTEMKQVDPNPGSLKLYEAGCPTCPGARTVALRPQNQPQSRDVIVPPTEVDQTELDAVLNQVEGTQTLIVSEEHTPPKFASPEEVWKFFSGDLAKLQEAAVAAGIKNCQYDQHAMSLAKKIYKAQ